MSAQIMDEKSESSTQIQTICTYANDAVRQGLMESNAHQQYVRAFEALVKRHISPRIYDNNQSAIQEMISVIFIIYDEMLDSPEKESDQSRKLSEYIETLLTHIENDTTYLQKWSMQSCFDALLQTKQLDLEPNTLSSESLEEFVDRNVKELDDLMLLEQQKLSILRDDNLFNDDDDDQLSQEMEKILNISFKDMYAEIPRTNQTEFDTDIDSLSTQAEELISTQSDGDRSPFLRTHFHSDTESRTTKADEFSESEDELSLSSHSSDSSKRPTVDSAPTDIESFSVKFYELIAQFHGQSIDQKMEKQERVVLEKTIDRVASYLIDAYQQFFKEGLTEDSLLAFNQISESVINNWTRWNEKPVSKSNISSVAPAFNKLNLNLLRLTDEMKQNLQDAPKKQSFKDLS